MYIYKHALQLSGCVITEVNAAVFIQCAQLCTSAMLLKCASRKFSDAYNFIISTLNNSLPAHKGKLPHHGSSQMLHGRLLGEPS